MLLDGALGDDERLGDTRVRPPLGHQLEHLALPRREHVERAAASDELAHDLGVERRAALRDAAHGVDEVAHVADALLQQVADRAAAVGEQLGRVRMLDVLREHEHREAGPPAARLDRGAKALVPERRRQTDVDDRDVGLLDHDRAEQVRAVVDGGHDLEAAVLEQADEPLAEQREVLGDHDAHGISARTIVGPPSGLVTTQRPVQRRDAVAEPGEPAAGADLGAAAAVVGDLDDRCPSWSRRWTSRASRPRASAR